MKGFATAQNRMMKAKKIEAVLSDYLNKPIDNMVLLDVGAGDGTASSYFAERNEVYCVDIEDQRRHMKAVFKEVNSAMLPFDDNMFDIVISNQVIEHINDQTGHLAEIHRVLKPEGICYLATPNKNFPIEPHYNMPLIHYLPDELFYGILKLFGLYTEPLFLLSYSKLKHLLKADFLCKEYTHHVLKQPDKYYMEIKLCRIFPLSMIKMMDIFMPSNIFILVK